MTVIDDPFATAGEISPSGADKTYGVAYRGRYHMPLLPGELGVKSGGDWVPYGIMRTSNLVSAFSESRALNIWEQEQMLIGLASSPSLYEELRLAVDIWRHQKVDFSRLRDYPEVRNVLSGKANDSESIDASLAGRARAAAGANEARQKGTNRHLAWEHRALTGELIGTPDIQEQIEGLEALLAAAHLTRVPGMQERVVRNTTVNCAGRFDDVLQDERTGEWLIADLKTKQREFWTWLEVDMQLAVYAYSEWMLSDVTSYLHGPLGRVNGEVGVVLHMPSNGDEPRLRRADLTRGWRNAQLARTVVDERAYGKNRERMTWAEWGTD